jgi:4-amino-4-deoxychorismate lyase
MRFIETLLITDKIENLRYHNERFNKTRKKFFNLPQDDLKNYVAVIPNKRVRVLYDDKIRKIEYFDLVQREFKRFKTVFNDDIEYSYKYENRDKLNSLKPVGYDEIIIVKNGLVTDTTISNLAFLYKNEWLTPKTPLLKGTKRAELLDKKLIKETDIEAKDLKKFNKFAMLNAIVGFYEIPISAIED